MTFRRKAQLLAAIAALALFGIGISNLIWWAGAAAGPERMAAMIRACTLFGASLGVAAATVYRKARGTVIWRSELDLSIALVGAGLLALMIWKFGMKQFGGFDHSALIDTGWRLARGQHPYADFPCSLPIGFYLGAKYAILLFGSYWRSFVIANLAFAVLTFLWTLWLLNKTLVGRPAAFLLAFAAQVASTVATSYWWYNSITAIAAILFFLSAWLLLSEPRLPAGRVSYASALLLLAMMKPNVAGLLIIGTTLVMISSKQHRWLVLSLSGSAFLAFLLCLGLEHLTLGEVVGGYTSVAGRAFTLKAHFAGFTIPERVCSIILLALVLTPLAFPEKSWQALLAGRRELWLCLVGALAGLYGFLTNGELKVVDAPLLLLAGSFFPLAVLGPREKLNTPGKWFIPGSAVALLILGLAFGQAVTRSRVWSIGPGRFFEFTLSKKPVEVRFFKGLHAGPRLRDTVKEVSQVLSTRRGEAVYFGPRMEWAYAAYGLSSPVGEPTWWDPGVSYNVTEETRYVRAWAAKKFDIAIFLKGDYTYLPLAVGALLQTEYSVDETSANLSVWKRKLSSGEAK